jgi:hypothetical protein
MLASLAIKDMFGFSFMMRSRCPKTVGANLEDKMKKAEELEKARLKRLEDYTNAI